MYCLSKTSTWVCGIVPKLIPYLQYFLVTFNCYCVALKMQNVMLVTMMKKCKSVGEIIDWDQSTAV